MKGLIAVLLLLCPAFAQQTTPRALEVLKKFDQLARQPLWPGFEPQKVAVELYDGTDTYLFHHPKPPEGFAPVAGAPGVFVFHGQHDSVRANTGTELNGVPTATADISKSSATIPEQAALLIHESFHVYERQAHPKWAANEAELFTYPFEDVDAFLLREWETRGLVDALYAHDSAQRACAISNALGARQGRFGRIGQGASSYERGVELNEGLAQYVEYKSIQKAPALNYSDFPLEDIRQRGYATGQAFALLLDVVSPGWQSHIGDTPLDELLTEGMRARGDTVPNCELPKNLSQKDYAEFKAEVASLIAARAQRKHDFLAAPGWRLEIVSGAEPLWPQGFDPWNVQNLGSNEILHTRWVKLGNKSGAIEIMNHASMTEGVGPHPLFNGEKRLIVTGLNSPKIDEGEGEITIQVEGRPSTFRGKVAIEAEGVRATFAGASVTQDGQTVVVKLP